MKPTTLNRLPRWMDRTLLGTFWDALTVPVEVEGWDLGRALLNQAPPGMGTPRLYWSAVWKDLALPTVSAFLGSTINVRAVGSLYAFLTATDPVWYRDSVSILWVRNLERVVETHSPDASGNVILNACLPDADLYLTDNGITYRIAPDNPDFQTSGTLFTGPGGPFSINRADAALAASWTVSGKLIVNGYTLPLKESYFSNTIDDTGIKAGVLRLPGENNIAYAFRQSLWQGHTFPERSELGIAKELGSVIVTPSPPTKAHRLIIPELPQIETLAEGVVDLTPGVYVPSKLPVDNKISFLNSDPGLRILSAGQFVSTDLHGVQNLRYQFQNYNITTQQSGTITGISFSRGVSTYLQKRYFWIRGLSIGRFLLPGENTSFPDQTFGGAFWDRSFWDAVFTLAQETDPDQNALPLD